MEGHIMAKLLVVDDSALDRYVAGALLEEHAGWKVAYAEDGKEALHFLNRETPDLVITDLQMPEINGLELVEAIHRDYPNVPVILMTAHGSEEIAAEAIRKGAASYVPKKNRANDLVPTVVYILDVARTNRNQNQVMQCLDQTEFSFVLANDPASLQPLIGHFQDLMTQMKLADRSGLIRVGTALHEALVNAIEHGNLELRSELRDKDDRKEYIRMLEKRRHEMPYRERRVHVRAKFSHAEAIFVIRDEGPGFDPSTLPDPTDPSNLERTSGRGLYLIRTFMDDVTFNSTGNEITLIKRRAEPRKKQVAGQKAKFCLHPPCRSITISPSRGGAYAARSGSFLFAAHHAPTSFRHRRLSFFGS
jgi:CheY-like chemotaxis protein